MTESDYTVSKPRVAYPPYFRDRSRPKKRVYCWLEYRPDELSVVVTTEDGEVMQFGSGAYDELRDTACEKGWTLITQFGAVRSAFPWLLQALNDRRATLLGTMQQIERYGRPSGVSWRVGRRRASVVSADAWGFTELNRGEHAVSPGEFLHLIRHVVDTVGVGDCDTLAALGTQAFIDAWQDSGLPRIWRLPVDCRKWFKSQPVRPRIWDNVVPARYPLLRELDLRSAYATALAGRLPLGQPCFARAETTPSDLVWGTPPIDGSDPEGSGALCYGLWKVIVSREIVRGPVGRIWKAAEGPSITIPPGEYEVPLWSEEATALVDAGASVTFVRGYIWLRSGTPFAPFVEHLKATRAEMESRGDDALAQMYKALPNKVIGRFNCTTSLEIVPAAEAAIGDAIVELDLCGQALPEAFDPDDPTSLASMVALHEGPPQDCVPEHWYSYISMKVALAVWRQEVRETEAGKTVVSANVDGLRVVATPDDYWPDPDLARMGWKQLVIRGAKIDAGRHIVGWQSDDGGKTWSYLAKRPGIKSSA